MRILTDIWNDAAEEEASIYKVEIHCANCRHFWKEEIPKGTSVVQYMAGRKCPNCDCNPVTEA